MRLHPIHTPPRAFYFYLPAAINYLRSPAASGDDESRCGFAMMLRLRLDFDASQLAPVLEALASTCAYILENWEKFEEPELDGYRSPEFFAPFDYKREYLALQEELRGLN